jgi:hypothetical protein
LRRVAGTPAMPPEVIQGTVRIAIVFVADLAEKMDAVRASEKCCCNRVYGCIAPALFICGLIWHVALVRA